MLHHVTSWFIGLTTAAMLAPGCAPTCGDLSPAAGGLVINEVVTSGDSEWVELFNGTDAFIDLAGYRIADDFCDTSKRALLVDGSRVLEPQGYYVKVLVRDTVGWALGSEDEIALFAPDGTAVDGVAWLEFDIPKGNSLGRIPNGTGAFEAVKSPTPSKDNAARCGDSAVTGDEQCDVDGVSWCDAKCKLVIEDPLASLRINEVSADEGWFELVNTGASEANSSGWYVRNQSSTLRHLATRTIPTGWHLTFEEKDLTGDPAGPAFGPRSTDSLLLFNGQGQLVDFTLWTDLGTGVSWGRSPDATGDFMLLVPTTSGGVNP